MTLCELVVRKWGVKRGEEIWHYLGCNHHWNRFNPCSDWTPSIFNSNWLSLLKTQTTFFLKLSSHPSLCNITWLHEVYKIVRGSQQQCTNQHKEMSRFNGWLVGGSVVRQSAASGGKLLVFLDRWEQWGGRRISADATFLSGCVRRKKAAEEVWK